MKIVCYIRIRTGIHFPVCIVVADHIVSNNNLVLNHNNITNGVSTMPTMALGHGISVNIIGADYNL